MNGPPEHRFRPSTMSDVDSDDIGSDFGPPSPTGSASASGSRSFDLNDDDKRAHHNALERKRRDHIKDSFLMLREVVPTLNGEKVPGKWRS
jgi:Helix-loop-helix DNA-binding domain